MLRPPTDRRHGQPLRAPAVPLAGRAPVPRKPGHLALLQHPGAGTCTPWKAAGKNGGFGRPKYERGDGLDGTRVQADLGIHISGQTLYSLVKYAVPMN
jgi:hypothetical protein